MKLDKIKKTLVESMGEEKATKLTTELDNVVNEMKKKFDRKVAYEKRQGEKKGETYGKYIKEETEKDMGKKAEAYGKQLVKEERIKARKEIAKLMKQAEAYGNFCREEVIKEGEKYEKYVKRQNRKAMRLKENKLVKQADSFGKFIEDDMIKKGEKYSNYIAEQTRKDYEETLGENFVNFIDSLNEDINKIVKPIKTPKVKDTGLLQELKKILKPSIRTDNTLKERVKELERKNFVLSEKLNKETIKVESLSEQVRIKKETRNLPIRKRLEERTKRLTKVSKPVLNEKKQPIKRQAVKRTKIVEEKSNPVMDKIQHLAGI